MSGCMPELDSFGQTTIFSPRISQGQMSSSLRECRHILSLSDVSKCIDDSRRNPQAMTGICRGGVSPSSSLVDSAPFEIIFFRDLQPMMFATSNQ